ncbi:uncharacterized protein B0H18DRAFT_1094842 [Fomitopsis serialis]|uniref:uncharacterized protein n=1 Tax=Fomitopsis serialis TaxID=139415 RepID=UPI002007DD18|nr:uncharacterized protein B0H18DRAFT_1094842 [Neoantrodia serialis]KAH9925747.1 hypothetical protein B0H18DRAFT_1094842 [Neoantrodia serialis]
MIVIIQLCSPWPLSSVHSVSSSMRHLNFGRFSPREDSIFLVDGIKSWIVFELVIPSALIWTYVRSPLSGGITPPLSPTHPSTFVVLLVVVHYINRAIISPLRSYLSSPESQAYLANAFSRPLFWAGVGLWALGLVGNVVHDEILLDIRRNNKSTLKPKDAADEQPGSDATGKRVNKPERYEIPYGYLYRYISYPNYLSEWIEWLGFGLAAALLPSFASPGEFLATLAPPHFFFINEIVLMLPRAYRGHIWYHTRFPD